MRPWETGMPKRVNNLTTYTEKLKNIRTTEMGNYRLNKLQGLAKKTNNMIPGHVRASINWNQYKEAMGDQYSMNIVDGMKVIVCKLKNNAMGYASIAYPTDESNLPEWFMNLPFDEDGMRDSVLTKKIHNVIGAMGYDLSKSELSDSFEEFFDF
jgi:hypothetical protein